MISVDGGTKADGNRAAALRAIPRDGGFSAAIKISEQPDAYVPAHLRRPR